MEKSSLAIPERVKPRDAMRFRILGLAKRIVVTIADNRKKIILSKFVRLTVQIGCMIVCRLTPIADIHLFAYATNETARSGRLLWFSFSSGDRTDSIEEPPPR
jgi:hypothetical protein